MKKLFLFVAIAAGLLFSAGAKAQAPIPQLTATYGNVLDTVVNTGSKATVAYKVPFFKTGISYVVVVTKISGTVGGTLQLEGSMDGTNFALIGSATTPGDATRNYSFNTTARYYYYRVSYTGAGTMSASFKAHSLLY